jgi:enolase-phosphatase E1
MKSNVKFILTDIEGTTTSVQFVYDVLFPYFRENINHLKDLTSNTEVQQAFKKTVELSNELEGKKLQSVEEIIATLLRWSIEDRKITPLKTVQGILWKEGYENGQIKGHVYQDVPEALKCWNDQGLKMGVFSSGSIAAQKLLFGFSEFGDLTPFFSAYFDTTTGGKREIETYRSIASQLSLKASEILFLSDIIEELEAAKEAGFEAIQLVRPGTQKAWPESVEDFSQINL